MSSEILDVCTFEIEGETKPSLEPVKFHPYAQAFWKNGVHGVRPVAQALAAARDKIVGAIMYQLMVVGGPHADFSVFRHMDNKVLTHAVSVMENNTYGGAWVLANIMKTMTPTKAAEFALDVAEDREDMDLMGDVLQMLFDVYPSIDNVVFKANSKRALCLALIRLAFGADNDSYAHEIAERVVTLMGVDGTELPALDNHNYFFHDGTSRFSLPKTYEEAMRRLAHGKNQMEKFRSRIYELLREKSQSRDHPKRRSTFQRSLIDCAVHDFVKLGNWVAGNTHYDMDLEVSNFHDAFEKAEDSDSSSDSSSDSGFDTSDSDDM